MQTSNRLGGSNLCAPDIPALWLGLLQPFLEPSANQAAFGSSATALDSLASFAYHLALLGSELCRTLNSALEATRRSLHLLSFRSRSDKPSTHKKAPDPTA
ncbi:hypothetical protein D3C84_785970 [compost metagenome]